MAMVAPKKAVNAPVKAMTFIAAGTLKDWVHPGNQEHPAATIVAAWIRPRWVSDLPLHPVARRAGELS